MPRYIDADAVVWEIEKNKCGLKDYDSALEVAIAEIKTFKTADVVEVVRCKDCKWYGIDELKKDGSLDRRYKPSVCYLYREHHEESWYCADAERRTE